MRTIRLNLFLLCMLLAFTGTTANAQTTGSEQDTKTSSQSTPLPDALSPASIEQLAGKLDPEQLDALANLIELLGKGTDTQAAPEDVSTAGWSSGLVASLTEFGTTMGNATIGLPMMIVGIGAALTNLFFGGGLSASGILFGSLILAIAAGLLVERLVAAGLARWNGGTQESTPEDLRGILQFLSLSFAISIASLLAFAMVAIAVLKLLPLSESDTALAVGIIAPAIMFPRIASVVLRFFLAPNRPELRLVTADDPAAKRFYSDFVTITAILGIILFLNSNLSGAGEEVLLVFRFWVGLSIFASICFAVWRNRAGMASIIRGDEEELTAGLERMAAWWPVFSIVVIILDWLMIRFLVSSGQKISAMQAVMTLVLIVVLPFIDTAFRGLVGHLQRPATGEGEVAEMASHKTRMSFIRIGRVVLVALLLMVTGRLWGIRLVDVAQAGFGAQFAANAFGLLLIFAMGYLAWELTNLWIYRRLSREAQGTDAAQDDEFGGAALSRMATILPLVRITLQATIIGLTVLLAASQIGINIAPLLAGAGVIGLAVGFGAQTLVKDIVSGMFFLLDDAFRVGEYVDVEGTVGTVEKISIRSFQLRHHLGSIHTIPYGEIHKLTNRSRDWVIVKQKFTVPFDTDLNKVRKLFKKIGQDMYGDDPYYAENILQPFKLQGVYNVDDVGIVVRGKFMAKPGTQFIIRKNVYSRIQQVFEENGIEFARKEVRVNIPSLDQNQNITDDQKKRIAAAASEAAEEATPSTPADDR